MESLVWVHSDAVSDMFSILLVYWTAVSYLYGIGSGYYYAFMIFFSTEILYFMLYTLNVSYLTLHIT